MINKYKKILVVAFIFTVMLVKSINCNHFSLKKYEFICDNYIVSVSEGNSEPESVGSFDIRIYQSTLDSFIIGLIGSRDGTIINSWVKKCDKEGNLDIAIWLQSTGSGAYGYVEIYKFDGQKIMLSNIPEPKKELLLGYRGKDHFEILDCCIIRQFPIYNNNDSNTHPTGGIRKLKYCILAEDWILVD